MPKKEPEAQSITTKSTAVDDLAIVIEMAAGDSYASLPLSRE